MYTSFFRSIYCPNTYNTVAKSFEPALLNWCSTSDVIYPQKLCQIFCSTFFVISLLSAFCYSTTNLQTCVKSFYENKHLMIYYMMPSLLYCMYNNLSFKNLSQFDPTTYLLLLQLRLLMTGVIYQVGVFTAHTKLFCR